MNASEPFAAVYGAPPLGLADVSGAVQCSPLAPGARALEDLAPGALSAMTMLAPPGTAERRYAMALGLKALAGAGFTVMAPKVKGGSRLKGELEAFGLAVTETAKAHHRICFVDGAANPAALARVIAEGAPRIVPALGLWSQPGVFSWDRADPGSVLLIGQLPALEGRGADLGCGIGLLAHRILASAGVTALTLIDLDRRAVDCARRNTDDPRAQVIWADVRGEPALEGLDFVVMNPPFHDGGAEDRSLGQAFIRRAAAALRKGGVCWLVANRHLPYEAPLTEAFSRFSLRAEAGGYKIYEAVK